MKKIVVPVVLVLCFAVSAFAGDSASTARSMVDKGIAHVESVGAKQAAGDFMRKDGGFIDGDYYLLFYQYDGTCIALGAKPEIAGKNRWDVKDPDGVYQIREMIAKAKSGGGWVQYKYANPTSGKVENKKTYVQPVPGMEAFVGCGIYY